VVSKNRGSIVIGDFSDIKQNINIGKKNNEFLASNSQHLPKVVAKRYGCVNHPPRLKLNDLVA